jgi:hypothetical protein
VIAYLISVTVIVVGRHDDPGGAGDPDRADPGGRRRRRLAVGFGAQHLVQDIISGFFILLDDEIRVGDVVQIADKAGSWSA